MKASDRMIQLPGAAPMLILLTSADVNVVRLLDERIIAAADTVDVRSGVAWIEVSDCLDYLRRLVEHIPDGDNVRVAMADLSAGAAELVSESMLSVTLTEVAASIEQEDMANAKIDYEVRYQPIVRLGSRSIVGYEALIRARLGTETLTAEDLISRATRGGWLQELDITCRRYAIQGVGSWLGAGLLFLNIMAPDGSFDLSAARATIRHAEDIGIEPDQIVFEAAERNRYVDIDLAAAQLTKLRNAGVRIALDDVGDGYSSLRVATSFKPDVLKLSGDLVASLPSSEATAIIKAVVSLAHQTGAWVVAEGIETEAQAAALSQLDVDWGQGLLFGGPAALPAD